MAFLKRVLSLGFCVFGFFFSLSCAENARAALLLLSLCIFLLFLSLSLGFTFLSFFPKSFERKKKKKPRRNGTR